MNNSRRRTSKLAMRVIAPLLLCVLTGIAVHANAKKPALPGKVTGTVSFAGKPPAPAKVNRATDPFCARQQGSDAAIVVSKQGGLAGALVSLKGKRIVPDPPPEAPVIIHQTDCSYVPRVSGAVVGQTIEIRNGDPTLHNVHGYAGKSTAFNLAQPKGAKPIRRTADDPGVLELKCDVHPWMQAYVVALPHRYFVVTGEDGSFAIDGVPPGRYTLEAWHPTLGTQQAELTVSAGQASAANLRFGG